MQFAVADVGNTRGEAESENASKPEDMVGNSAAIGVVNRQLEVGLVIKQTIDDVRSLAALPVNTVVWKGA